jgi:hypothetical protein
MDNMLMVVNTGAVIGCAALLVVLACQAVLEVYRIRLLTRDTAALNRDSEVADLKAKLWDAEAWRDIYARQWNLVTKELRPPATREARVLAQYGLAELAAR